MRAPLPILEGTREWNNGIDAQHFFIRSVFSVCAIPVYNVISYIEVRFTHLFCRYIRTAGCTSLGLGPETNHILFGGDEFDRAAAQLGALILVEPRAVVVESAHVRCRRQVAVAAEVAPEFGAIVSEEGERVHIRFAALAAGRAILT